MRLKPIAMGGAAVLALALGANLSFAQTTNDTSAPAQSQATPADNATDTTSATNTTDTAASAKHHYRHHTQRVTQTARENRKEDRETADLNKEQVAKVDGQAGQSGTSTASTTAPSTDANATTASTTMDNNAPNMNASAGPQQNTTVAQTTTSPNSPAAPESNPAATPRGESAANPEMGNQTAPNSSGMAPGKNGATMASAQSLDTVKDPKQTLSSVAVQNSSGQQIGTVQKVTVGSNGKTQAVDVQVQGQAGSTPKTVRLDANDLSYDKSDNVLVTPLTSDQINSLPSPM